MLEHNSHENHLNSSKILAAMRLEKLKKQRHGRKKRTKRELLEVTVPVEITDLHVTGSSAWAPLQQGTVRLVKRFS